MRLLSYGAWSLKNMLQACQSGFQSQVCRRRYFQLQQQQPHHQCHDRDDPEMNGDVADGGDDKDDDGLRDCRRHDHHHHHDLAVACHG